MACKFPFNSDAVPCSRNTIAPLLRSLWHYFLSLAIPYLFALRFGRHMYLVVLPSLWWDCCQCSMLLREIHNLGWMDLFSSTCSVDAFIRLTARPTWSVVVDGFLSMSALANIMRAVRFLHYQHCNSQHSEEKKYNHHNRHTAPIARLLHHIQPRTPPTLPMLDSRSREGGRALHADCWVSLAAAIARSISVGMERRERGGWWFRRRRGWCFGWIRRSLIWTHSTMHGWVIELCYDVACVVLCEFDFVL